MSYTSRQTPHFRRFFTLGALCPALLLSAFLAGCSSVRGIQENVSFDLASQPTIFQDQWARRNPPLVYVHPAEPTDTQLTALFMPFRVTQPISEPEMIGYSQARIVWHNWLSKRLFSIMEFDGDHGPFRRDRAVALARAKGADLAIGGFVTYYYAGGPDTDNQVALQIEIYDTASGQLVWSMGQSALMPARTVNDYLIFATQTRQPSDPMFALAQTIADDMGKILATWTPTGDSTQFSDGFTGGEAGDDLAPQPVHPSF